MQPRSGLELNKLCVTHLNHHATGVPQVLEHKRYPNICAVSITSSCIVWLYKTLTIKPQSFWHEKHIMLTSSNFLEHDF